MTALWKVFSLMLLLQLVGCNVRRPGRRGRTKSTGKPKQVDIVEEFIEAAKEAKEGDHNHQVQLRYAKTGDHFCGGSILNSFLVLTAAHCVYNQNKSGSLDQIEVVAGEHDTKEISGHEQVRHIWQVFIHESYIFSTGASDNDVALLVIQPAFKLNDFVAKIAIPYNVSNTAGSILSGFGKKHKDDTTAVQVLHNINLTVYEDKKCEESWADKLKEELGRDVDLTRILCARHNEKGKPSTKLTSCDGDSGGPLTCTDFTNHTSDRFLCGVTTGADKSCGQVGGKPGVFANVIQFFPWITEKFNKIDLTYGCPCGYFRCNNAHCVDPKTFNDRNDDCGDESDESPGIRERFDHAYQRSRKHWDVEDTMYKCHYNKTHPDRFRLISVDYLCDGFEDCPGNTEGICDNLKQNPSLCPNSVKEATQSHSDIPNCKHITDETNCKKCRNSTKCLNEDKCIPNEALCDLYSNCQDGSDEKNCKSCSSQGFHCPISQTCIRSSYRCDGERDCPNGEDEKNCHTCHSTELNFHCPSNMSCIHSQLRCDGTSHCPEGEDEENCDDCKSTGFLCKQERKCIPDYFRCDAHIDCKGGDDEKNCTDCKLGRFLCKVAQKCILKKQRCDGSVDCTETNEDEICTYCSRPHLFHCPSENKCIQRHLKCNGEKDCRGDEDEAKCNSCSNDCLYHCSRSRKCIAKKRWCDKKSECEHNEDEEYCPTESTPLSSYEDCYDY